MPSHSGSHSGTRVLGRVGALNTGAATGGRAAQCSPLRGRSSRRSAGGDRASQLPAHAQLAPGIGGLGRRAARAPSSRAAVAAITRRWSAIAPVDARCLAPQRLAPGSLRIGGARHRVVQSATAVMSNIQGCGRRLRKVTTGFAQHDALGDHRGRIADQ